LYETLESKEDMLKAENFENYYRVPADNRDLNYAKYFSEGSDDLSSIDDYHSHNTERLSIDGLKAILMKLDIIKQDLCWNNRAKWFHWLASNSISGPTGGYQAY
jgi:UDP-glucose 4-epimerase